MAITIETQDLTADSVWLADVVELDFPMEVRTVRGRKRQSGRFAVMCGPVVYALNTHEIGLFKDWFPWDVQGEMMVDPKRLAWEDGKITTYAEERGISDEQKLQMAVDCTFE